MFFLRIIEILILIGFCWLLWKFIIKPILEGHGIEVDEPEEIKTDYTKRLKKTKRTHAETKASVNAIRKEAKLTDAINDMTDEINRTEDEIKK